MPKLSPIKKGPVQSDIADKAPTHEAVHQFVTETAESIANITNPLTLTREDFALESISNLEEGNDELGFQYTDKIASLIVNPYDSSVTLKSALWNQLFGAGATAQFTISAYEFDATSQQPTTLLGTTAVGSKSQYLSFSEPITIEANQSVFLVLNLSGMSYEVITENATGGAYYYNGTTWVKETSLTLSFPAVAMVEVPKSRTVVHSAASDSSSLDISRSYEWSAASNDAGNDGVLTYTKVNGKTRLIPKNKAPLSTVDTTGASTGQVLTVNASGAAVWSSAAQSTVSEKITEFLTSGSFLVPAGVTKIMVRASGGGGGGGGGGYSTQAGGGGGGGGAAILEKYLTVTPGETLLVSIGAGGNGGSGGVGGGTLGTSFGSGKIGGNGGSTMISGSFGTISFAGGGAGGGGGGVTGGTTYHLASNGQNSIGRGGYAGLFSIGGNLRSWYGGGGGSLGDGGSCYRFTDNGAYSAAGIGGGGSGGKHGYPQHGGTSIEGVAGASGGTGGLGPTGGGGGASWGSGGGGGMGDGTSSSGNTAATNSGGGGGGGGHNLDGTGGVGGSGGSGKAYIHWVS